MTALKLFDNAVENGVVVEENYEGFLLYQGGGLIAAQDIFVDEKGMIDCHPFYNDRECGELKPELPANSEEAIRNRFTISEKNALDAKDMATQHGFFVNGRNCLGGGSNPLVAPQKWKQQGLTNRHIACDCRFFLFKK